LALLPGPIMNASLAPTPLRHHCGGCRIGPNPQNPLGSLSFGRLRVFGTYIASLARVRLRGAIGSDEHGRLLRQLFESLGGTWTKLGQLLGMRRDVFSSEFCVEMSKVQNQAAGFAGSIARRIVEEDIGAAIGTVFSQFTESPVAAASIGQVHQARLRDSGMRVAVKVRRPFAVEQMELDFLWLSRIFRLLHWCRFKPSFAWSDLLWELKTALHEELDYRLEGTYLARMRKSLSPHGIHVPAVFLEYTTSRVLVMEFIEGVFMSEFIAAEDEDPDLVARWLAENNISREKVGRTLNHSLNRQIFEDNFFHSDLHPGNIVLLRNSEIALIDFGAVGSLEAEFLRKYALYYQAIVNRQFERAVDLVLLLAAQEIENSRAEEFRKCYIRLMNAFETRTATRSLSFHERSIVSVFGDIMTEIARLEIPLDWSFMRADRAQLTLDASLMYLLPGVDYLELTSEYWRASKRRATLKSVRLSSRKLAPAAGLIEHVLRSASERSLAAELLRTQSTVSRTIGGTFVVVRDAVLRLCSNTFACLFVAGTITYLQVPGVADLASKVHLSAAVASWRSLPPAFAILVLILLFWLSWRTARIGASLRV
jgi:ubiquinone biosynthesis protein